MDLFYYLEDACMGMITFIDELDSNINDVYLDKIIEYFILYGKGQLCFTSHNLSPMSVLKKNKKCYNHCVKNEKRRQVLWTVVTDEMYI